MSAGSGLFSGQSARLPHLVRGTGGLAGEVADLREDVERVMSPLAAIAVEEWTNVAATAPAALEAATATTVAPRTVTSFVAGGVAALAAIPRNITFTTAGSTASDAPATAVITGRDVNGAVQTETVTLAQTATIALGAKCFSSISSVAYAAADGTGATVSIGIGDKLGLSKPVKARATGVSALVREIVGGVELSAAGLVQEEFTNPPAADPDGFVTATATSTSIVTFSGAGLNGAVGAAALTYPRNVTVTASDSAASYTGAVTFTGLDVYGNVITEAVTISNNATAVGAKAFKQITLISVVAQVDTSGSLQYGFGALIGLAAKGRVLTGTTVVKPIQELSAGSVVTNGTFAAPGTGLPNGTYSPNTAANGTNDYAVLYMAEKGAVQAPATAAPNGAYIPSVSPGGGVDISVSYEFTAT